MRYIGSKAALLPILGDVVDGFDVKGGVFCDLFSGTAAVAQYFKKDYSVLSNDILYFSYAIQYATIVNSGKPAFRKLSEYLGQDPFLYFNDFDDGSYVYKSPLFVFDNFCPGGTAKRQYFSDKNGRRIDAFRQLIDEWRKMSLLDNCEYYYLLAGLIESIPWVSNIAGTYGAYLKHWDKRAFKKVVPNKYPVIDNKLINASYNMDANKLLEKISGQILYIDPPYNGRQYISNYHVLESIALYDAPVLRGVTGLRSDHKGSSDFCKKNRVHSVFEDLIKKANFEHIVVSYSNEGLMSESEIKEILCEYCIADSYSVMRIPYRRYKRVLNPSVSSLHELIFSIKKS